MNRDDLVIGAGQAILDARCLADLLAVHGIVPEALAEYDRVRNAGSRT